MRHHSIICRLGVQDTAPVTTRRGSVVTEVSFIDGHSRLSYGLGQLIDQLGRLGLCPSEVATDLGILAALITAADTRISRVTESENNWTRQIDLHLPVQNPAIWTAISATIDKTLNFLTGDHWQTFFRSRIPALPRLATQPTRLPTANPSGVCLFSGGLDSFIGAIDLVSAGETPMLISHYWDPNTSPQQIYCGEKIKSHFSAAPLHHLRARIGFSNGTVGASGSENTLRGRSFLFFAWAQWRPVQ